MNANENGFRISLEDLLQFSDNCRALLRDTLLASRPVFDRPIQPSLCRFQTIRQIAAHMIGAEEYWIRHRINKEKVTRYESRTADSIEGLFKDWESVRTGTKTYVAGLNRVDFHKLYNVELAGGWSGDLAVEHILFHILNHEVHHRAQISMALQQFHIDPPDFDFVFLR